MKARLALSVLALIISGVSAQAATSVDLQFNGSGNSLAATGFDGVYQEDTSNYNVGGGSLTINIQPGDIFGRYEASSDPDDAKNVFYSNLDAQTSTTVQAKLTANNLNQNFHGGGIWLGTDEDHYIRLGLSHNTFEGGVVVEVLRENEDLWPGEGGPGGDILSARSTPVGSPLSAVTIWLKLVRDGSAAQGYFSTDGLGWTSVGPQFTGIVTGPGQGYNGGPTIEGGFKVGVWAFGGDANQQPASVSFDSFSASAVPEPGSLLALGAGLIGFAGALRRRVR